ncbi:MerR family DNA-binding transcriptional regulator [Paenibacillus sp. GCM10027627]|uniref:MerR family transcriptional regulator n=1 Tax=unclassified Paenibacillus TaxID=185978 RepID=UPI0036391A42
MSPKKLAEKYGLSASTLRNYEDKGLLPPAERSPSGYRMYSDRHEAFLACIQAMAPAFGMELTVGALRSFRQGQLHEALWAIRGNEVRLYREKESLDQLIQMIHRYELDNKAATDKKRFTIKEASEWANVSKSAIRYWEQEGYITAERDAESRFRRYSQSQLLKISLIQTLQCSVYSEETVKLKQRIAEAEHTDLQSLAHIAESIRIYLDRMVELQMRAIVCFYSLIQWTNRKSEALD